MNLNAYLIFISASSVSDEFTYQSWMLNWFVKCIENIIWTSDRFRIGLFDEIGILCEVRKYLMSIYSRLSYISMSTYPLTDEVQRENIIKRGVDVLYFSPHASRIRRQLLRPL